MQIVTLGSGSKGNCTLIMGDHCNILIDAGLPIAQMESYFTQLNISPNSIKAILVTHEHSDHIKSVGIFARKYNCKIVANSYLWSILSTKIGKIANENKIAFDTNWFDFDEFQILPFALPHDSYLCFGYTIKNNNTQFTIATDLGELTDQTLQNFDNSSLVILEANHEIALLCENKKYTADLKRRILSTHGHLSNDACAIACEKLYYKNVKQIVLAHLSEENNSPALAYKKVKQYLLSKNIVEGQHIYIDVATQRKMGNIFEIR